MGKLTHVQIQSWIKAGNPVAKSDGGDLTFTFSASGVAAWVLRYRFGGKAKEKTIGRYPDISLIEARKLASESRARIQAGTDVALQKKKDKHSAAIAWTVIQLAENYLEKAKGRLAAATIKGRKQQLRDYVYPLIGNYPARDVAPTNIVEIVERVAGKSRHVARLVLIAIREVFAHGIRYAADCAAAARPGASSVESRSGYQRR